MGRKDKRKREGRRCHFPYTHLSSLRSALTPSPLLCLEVFGGVRMNGNKGKRTEVSGPSRWKSSFVSVIMVKTKGRTRDKGKEMKEERDGSHTLSSFPVIDCRLSYSLISSLTLSRLSMIQAMETRERDKGMGNDNDVRREEEILCLSPSHSISYFQSFLWVHHSPINSLTVPFLPFG